jgi:hypothetical protein
MGCRRTSLAWRPCRRSPRCRGGRPALGHIRARADCLEQLLEAFRDIDRDDIHEAARRLVLVQEWIRSEAEAAAGDAIFADLSIV